MSDTAETVRANTKRAMFTINNATFADCQTLWDLGHSDKITYLVYGAEHDDGAEGHTPHLQGFVIFSKLTRCNTVCRLLGGRCWVGFPKATDPSAKCANYCKKEGFYMEFGRIPGSRSAGDEELSAKEMRRKAIEWLDCEENKYCRWKNVPATLLMTPGFLAAWTAKRKVLLGPDRPDLRIITIVGPTACGKSYASHNLLPDHAKCFYGNSGAWFSNGDAPVLLIEEFSGQIPLQKMLTILDHYPFQLEEKGGFSPALYTTVVITSNITPDHWYSNFVKQGKMAEEAMRLGIPLDEAEKRWNEAKKALFDRIGFRTNKRGSGFYREWAHSGLGSEEAECQTMRQEIWDWLSAIVNPQLPESLPDLPPAHGDFDHDPVDHDTQELDDDDFEPPAQMRRMDAMPDLSLYGDDLWAEQWLQPPS